MFNKLYNIGEFAAINKITSRMLRHYDKIGLLKPAIIGENGYRIYSSEQIATVGLIKKYRDCEFSLKEIEVLLKADEQEVKRFIQGKIQEFYKQESSGQIVLERLRKLSGKESMSFENHYEISFSQQNERILFCLEKLYPEDYIDQAFNKLYDALDYLSVVHSGLPMLLSNLQENDAYRVAVPVKEPLSHTSFQCIVLQAGWYLSTFHYGDYYNIGEAYDSLLLYAQKQKLQLIEPFIERYFVDIINTSDSAKYITEISIKIAP
ncbi:MerR family transcriptional regulator [Clostridium sp. Marseille-QA1073]